LKLAADWDSLSAHQVPAGVSTLVSDPMDWTDYIRLIAAACSLGFGVAAVFVKTIDEQERLTRKGKVLLGFALASLMVGFTAEVIRTREDKKDREELVAKLLRLAHPIDEVNVEATISFSIADPAFARVRGCLDTLINDTKTIEEIDATERQQQVRAKWHLANKESFPFARVFPEGQVEVLFEELFQHVYQKEHFDLEPISNPLLDFTWLARKLGPNLRVVDFAKGDDLEKLGDDFLQKRKTLFEFRDGWSRYDVPAVTYPGLIYDPSAKTVVVRFGQVKLEHHIWTLSKEFTSGLDLAAPRRVLIIGRVIERWFANPKDALQPDRGQLGEKAFHAAAASLSIVWFRLGVGQEVLSVAPKDVRELKTKSGVRYLGVTCKVNEETSDLEPINANKRF
jgi:hypothetical protein